jgi:hypothetical protein
MGCSSSKQTAEIHELAPRPGHGRHTEPDLSKATLQRALQNVARYLQSRRIQVMIIAVGGAVNTLFLQTRNTTHDIDFFNQSLRPDELQLIRAAAQYARTQDRSLPDEWLNNRTVLFIPGEARTALTQEAIAMNEVVFEEPGLQVLAAPWDYAFCAKLDRISGSAGLGQRKPYDITDAVAYLYRYLTIKGRQSVTKGEIQQWAARYRTRIADGVLERVNAEFQRRYGWMPIVI